MGKDSSERDAREDTEKKGQPGTQIPGRHDQNGRETRTAQEKRKPQTKRHKSKDEG
jgi:hypothetical protein